MKTSIAFVSTALPPSASGQAKVLERLVAGRPETDYWFLSDNAETFTQAMGEGYGRYIRLSAQTMGLINREFREPIGAFNRHMGYLRPAKARARELQRLLRDVPLKVVVGCSGNPFDLMAASLVSKKLSASFVAYLFDDPVFQWPEGKHRSLARRFEPLWSKAASAIICPNEILADEFKQRTGKTAAIVRNPFDDAAAPQQMVSAMPARSGPVRIIYTGSIYHAHRDAFENLLAAMALMPGRYRLDVYTHQEQAALAAYGLTGPDIGWHSYLGAAEVSKVQQEADILFLPLAFKSTIQEVLLSSAPAKMAEYLLSGRPVLVHAPAGSFAATFFQSREAGYVVDHPSVPELALGLQLLSDDAELGARLGKNAQLAAKDFSTAQSRSKFWSVIDQLP